MEDRGMEGRTSIENLSKIYRKSIENLWIWGISRRIWDGPGMDLGWIWGGYWMIIGCVSGSKIYRKSIENLSKIYRKSMDLGYI